VSAEPSIDVGYLSVCDPATLEPVSRVTGDVLLLGAVRIGRVRLIDNLLIKISRRGQDKTSR
jgi:pantoate--beta-alanine ligase